MIWKNVLVPHYRKISRFVSPEEFHIEFQSFYDILLTAIEVVTGAGRCVVTGL